MTDLLLSEDVSIRSSGILLSNALCILHINVAQSLLFEQDGRLAYIQCDYINISKDLSWEGVYKTL